MTSNETTQPARIIPTVPTTDRLLWGTRRGIATNHNETVLRADWARRGMYFNHNETVLRAGWARRGIAINHNETVLRADWARRGMYWNHNEMARVTMYSTMWCGDCGRLTLQMDQAGIEYVEIDIERDPEAARYVEGVNGGTQTVPTVRFRDGTALTNPPFAVVAAKMADLAA